MKGVQRATLDQTFENALVQGARIHFLAKVEKAAEPPALTTVVEDGSNRPFAYVPDCQEAETYLVPHRTEVQVAFVHVRRKNGNPHVPALGDVHNDLLRVSDLAREQGSHELHGMMLFEICRLISQERISCGVRLVEPVLGEVFHKVEDLNRDLLRYPLLPRSRQELLPVGFHRGAVLLTHRLAEDVRLSEGESAQPAGYLHDLFLVDNDAVRLFQDWLEGRVQVLHFDLAVLPLDELGDHFHGPGAVQRIERDEVFEPFRTQLAQLCLHPAALKLEYSVSARFGEQGIDLGVVERQHLKVQLDPFFFVDALHGLVQHGQRGKGQEIHLQQADSFQIFHAVLRRDFVLVRLVQGNNLDQWFRGDDDAGRVRGSVTGQPFQPLCDLDEPRDLRIFHLLAQPRFLFDCLVNCDFQVVGDQLRNTVHVPVRNVQRSADVPHDAFGSHSSEGDDLAHIVTAVFPAHVVQDLGAPVHAEIHVDVGRRDSFRVEKAFEEEVILERVDIGDPQAVSHQAADHRAPSGPDGNAIVASILDEVPDNEEVAGELRLLDHFNLGCEPFLVSRERILKQPSPCHPLQLGAPALKTLTHNLLEIRVRGESSRDVKGRQMQFRGVDLDITTLGDADGIQHRLGQMSPDLIHLFKRLEVKLVGGVTHPIRLLDGLAGADAEQHVMRFMVLSAQIMGVVRADQGDAAFPGDFEEAGIDAALPRQVVVLKFQEEVLRSKNVLKRPGFRQSRIELVQEQPFRYGSLEAARKRNQPLAVLREKLFVHARLVVEALKISVRNEPAQVLISRGIFRQKYEMVGLVAAPRFLVTAFLGHIHLAPDDGLEPLRSGLGVELNCAKEVAVVGDRHGRHPHGDGRVHQLIHFGRAVEQAVIGMIVQMNECSRLGQELLPFDCAWRLGSDVVDDAIDPAHLVDDPVGYPFENPVRKLRPVGGHPVLAGHHPKSGHILVGPVVPHDPNTADGQQDRKRLPEVANEIGAFDLLLHDRVGLAQEIQTLGGYVADDAHRETGPREGLAINVARFHAELLP